MILLAIALLSIPLALAWPAFAKQSGRIALVVLLLATTSHLWALALLWFAPWIAPDYSDRRFLTIALNLAVMVVATILAIVTPRMRRQLVLASCIDLVLWCYIAAVSSAV